MNARDLMTSSVITTTPEAPLVEAIDTLIARRISGLPVCDAHGRLVGMLTEGDLLQRSEMGTAGRERGFWKRLSREERTERYVRLHGRHVGAVMTKGCSSVGPDDDVAVIVERMQSLGVRRVTVVEDGRLLGLITRHDIVRALRDRLRDDDDALSDAAIAARISATLQAERWAPRDVTVSEGCVAFGGEARDERDLDGLRAIAGEVPGVVLIDTDRVFLRDGLGFARSADIAAGIGPMAPTPSPSEWFAQTRPDDMRDTAP